MRESKIFESGGFIVTTERLVYAGSKVVLLDDINGGALSFVDKGWMGTFVIAGIGLLMLLFGGLALKILGILTVIGAYYFLQGTTERTVVLSVAGEALVIKVDTTELGVQLADAINRGLGARKRSRTEALRDELSSLPSA